MTDPERLDALLAGAAPRDDEERIFVTLAREVREAVPPAPPGLRARVRGLTTAPARPPWWRRGAPAWRRAGAVAAPLALAAVAAALVVPSLRDGGGPPVPAGSRAPAPQGGAAEVAPSAAAPAPMAADAAGAAPALVRVRDLTSAERRARRLVRRAGGRITGRSAAPGRIRLTARVPPARTGALLAGLDGLGVVARRSGAAPPVGGRVAVTVVLVDAP